MVVNATGTRDFWAGLMFMAFGLGFMWLSREYAMGSAVRMGPAYFPIVLGGMLGSLGAAIFARAFFLDSGRLPHWALRPESCCSSSGRPSSASSRCASRWP